MKKKRLLLKNLTKLFTACKSFTAYTLLITCILFTNCILLTSCAGKEKEPDEPESTEAESKPLKLQDLTALDIVADRAAFPAAAQDQSYNSETDMDINGSSVDDITESKENIYFNYMNALFMIPKNGDTVEIVCDDPDCKHVLSRTPSCLAALAPSGSKTGLQYYDGNLFYVVADKAGLALYKSTLNASLKRQFAFLDEKKVSIGGYLADSQWVLHRGYIYFWNEGRGIYRMPLEDTSVTELIMAMPTVTDMLEEKIFFPMLKAYGSYVYFTFPNEEKGYFLRHNIESGQLEQFADLPGNLDNFVVRDGKIYYSVQSENGIYQYDIATGENTLFLQEEHTIFSFLADTDYIYVPQKNSETTGKSGDSVEVLADVYTWSKELVGTVPFGREVFVAGGKTEEEPQIFSYGELDMIGSGGERIYYKNTAEQGEKTKLIFRYINKSEISEGTLHEAGEFVINS